VVDEASAGDCEERVCNFGDDLLCDECSSFEDEFDLLDVLLGLFVEFVEDAIGQVNHKLEFPELLEKAQVAGLQLPRKAHFARALPPKY